MSSPSLTGLSANNPLRYLGPAVSVPIIVIRNRQPTGADIKQPNTGKYYSFGTLWLIGDTSPGVPPTTGERGEMWYLGYIASNVAVWLPLFSTVDLGQSISSIIPESAPVAITSGVVTNVTSIVLTEGSWDVSGIVMFTGLTTTTRQNASIGTSSASIPLASYGNNTIASTFASTTVEDVGLSIPSFRIEVSTGGSQTVFLIARATFSASSSPGAYGRISATRVG